jgi:hypothetical protein
LPSSQPSQSPTILYRSPEITQVSINASNTYVKVTWNLDGNCKFAGTLYSAIFVSSSTNLTKTSDVKSVAIAVPYLSYQSQVSVVHSGLAPFVSYSVFAYTETLAGYVNPMSVVLASKRTFTTTCCRSVSLTSSPSFIYADSSKYLSSSESLYTFRYSLSSVPSKNVFVVPVFRYANGSRVPADLLTSLPSSAYFLSSSLSLQGSFVVHSSRTDISGSFLLSLNVSGASSAEYDVSSTTAKIALVGSGSNPPSPSLSISTFGDSGKDFYILFDSWTDMAGKVFREKWTCNELLQFSGANSTTCTWLNMTAINGVFPAQSSMDSSSLLTVGGNVTLLAGKLRPYCKASGSCTGYNTSNSQTVRISAPSNAVSPSVILMTPSRVGTCDNVTVSAMLTSGSGGRAWQSVKWSLYALDGDNAVDSTAILKALTAYGTNLGHVMQLPRSYIRSGKVTLSMTATNFFGKSSTGSTAFTIVDDPLVPNVYIAGSSMVYMRAYSPYTAYSSVSVASCSKSYASSVRTMYSWALYLDDTNSVVSVSSTSRTMSVYSLPAFSLTAGKVYSLLLNVTIVDQSGKKLSYSSAKQGITVTRGNLYARISGGNSRQLPINKNYTFSAAASYDEDSSSSRLSYSWSCEVTSLANFGGNCSTIFLNNNNVSSPYVKILGSALNTSLTYGVSVTVRSSDGRSSQTTVTVQGTSLGGTAIAIVGNKTTVVEVETEIVSKDLLINYNSNFSVTSMIQSTVDTITRWEIYIDGRNQSVDVNSPLFRALSAVYTETFLPITLVLQAFTFTPGSVVTFRIYAESAYTPSTSSSSVSSTMGRRHLQTSSSATVNSYSEISLTINGPPTDGVVTCSPNTGTALSTVFAVSTSDWEDTNPADFPLRYVFQYSLATGILPSLTIQSLSTISTVSSQLPAGLQSYGYVVVLQVTAYDIHDAASTAVQTNVTVTVDSSVNFTSYLSANLATSLASGDVGTAFQVLGNVASMINAVNCSVTPAAYCDSMYRLPCVNTPNTCGTCKSGYTGIVGNANSRCFDQTSTAGKTGSSCSSGDDCLYGSCSNGVCVTPLSTCLTSVEGSTCSGHGYCSFQDRSGRSVESSKCTITNLDCTPVCQCMDGYGAKDCSLSQEALLERSSLRGSLCGGVSSLKNATDESSSMLESLSGSILSSYAPDEVVSDGDYSLCASALSDISVMASDGYLAGAPVSVVENLLNSASSFVDSSLNLTAERSSAIQTVLDNIVSGLADSMSPGSFPIEVSSDNVRLVVRRDFASDLINQTLSPPATEAEEAYGRLGTSMQFDAASTIDACSDGTGYVKLALAGYGRVPFPNSTQIEAPMLKVSSSTPSASSSYLFNNARQNRREMMQSQSMLSTMEDDAAAAYYFTVQFMSEQDFQYNLTAREIAAGGHNLTFPECRVYDTDSGSYKMCSGCTPATYTNFNVTFVCTDMQAICGGGSISRRLLGRSLQTADDDGGSTAMSAQQYGAIVEAAAAAFVSVLSSNPFDVNIRQAAAILSLVGSLVVLFVTGGIYLYRMDEMEEEESILQKRWPPSVQHRKVLQDFGRWLCCCLPTLFKPEVVDTKKAKKPKKKYGNVNQLQLQSLEKIAEKTENDVDEQTEEASKVIIDTIIPDEFRSLGLLSFLHIIIRNHTYLLMFARPSYSSPRFIRWVQFTKSILLALFVDTLFFQVFYGNDGTCELYSSRIDCLTPQNAATANPKCMWEPSSDSLDGTCSLRPPPQDFAFEIMLALLTMLLSIPFDVGLGMIVDLYCNKKPDWSIWFHDNDKLLDLDAERLQAEKRKTYAGALNALLREESQPRNRRLVGGASIEEEIEFLKSQLSEHFQQSVIVDPSMSVADQDAWLEVKQARSEAIRRWLSIAEDGKILPLPWYSRWLGETWQSKLVGQLKFVLLEQEALCHTIGKLDDSNAHYLVDMILLHTFVLEQVSLFQKWVLVSKLGCFDDYTSQVVHPNKWLAGWAIVTSACLFFVYWIFAWGVQDGDAMLRAWGTNYGIGFVQDFFFVNVAKTVLFYLIGRQVILPQLQCVHDTLSRLSIERKQGFAPLRKQLPQAAFRVVEVLSASVRVASIISGERSKEIVLNNSTKIDDDSHDITGRRDDSDIAYILSSIDDYDVLHCKIRSSNRFGWAGWLIIFVPILLTMFGDQMADVSLDMAMPAFSSAFILFNYVLHQLGGIILAIPYVILAAVICWQQGLFRWMQRRMLVLEEEAANRHIPYERNNAYASPSQLHRRRLAEQHSNNILRKRRLYLVSKILQWLEPVFFYRFVFFVLPSSKRLQREKRERGSNVRWRAINLPYECQPIRLVANFGTSNDDSQKSSIIMRTSDMMSLENVVAVNVSATFTVPKEITQMLLSTSWKDVLKVPSGPESVDIRQVGLESNLFHVRKGPALDSWVATHLRHSDHRRQTSLKQSTTVANYKRSFGRVVDPHESLIRVLETYLWFVNGQSESAFNSFRRLAKKLIVNSTSSPFTLKPLVLIPVLRYVFSAHADQKYPLCCPQGKELSPQEVQEILDSFVVWAQCTPAEPIVDNSNGSSLLVAWSEFVSWFTFVHKYYSPANPRTSYVQSHLSPAGHGLGQSLQPSAAAMAQLNTYLPLVAHECESNASETVDPGVWTLMSPLSFWGVRSFRIENESHSKNLHAERETNVDGEPPLSLLDETPAADTNTATSNINSLSQVFRDFTSSFWISSDRASRTNSFH